jgi:hypothetical protein
MLRGEPATDDDREAVGEAILPVICKPKYPKMFYCMFAVQICVLDNGSGRSIYAT